MENLEDLKSVVRFRKRKMNWRILLIRRWTLNEVDNVVLLFLIFAFEDVWRHIFFYINIGQNIFNFRPTPKCLESHGGFAPQGQRHRVIHFEKRISR